jgi:O-antigen/teichoic acid export membrane protein
LALERPAAQVAYYGVAYRVIDFVVGLPALLMLALLPSLAQASRTRQRSMVQRAFDLLILAAIAVALGVAASAHVIVGILGGPAFYPAVRPLALLGVGAAISFGSAVYGHALLVLGEQRRLLRIIVAITIVNLAANLVFIRYWGPNGAALALDLSELVGLVLLDQAFRRASSAGPSWRQLGRLAPATITVTALWFAARVTVARSDSFIATGATVAALGLVFVALAAATGALRPLGLSGSRLSLRQHR